MAETGAEIISGYIGPDETTRLARELHSVVESLADVLSGQ